MYKPNNEPTSLEQIIFKWVFLPILACGLLYILFQFIQGDNKCESICMKKGFHDFRYIPRSRVSLGNYKCYCLTEEESKIKNPIPKGTRVF